MIAISTQTTEALRQAHALVERDQALSALVGVLDPKREAIPTSMRNPLFVIPFEAPHL